MNRTYKRKLILTKKQEVRLNSWIGACRVVYNMGMEIKNTSYRTLGKNVHKYALSTQLKDVRSFSPWINDVPFNSLSCVLSKLENAYSDFFKTFKKGGGYPKFASKKKYKSITFKEDISIINNRVKIPKIGKLKIFKDAPIIGKICTANIKKEPTGYFITIVCKDVPPRFVSENQAIGLDMGITKFYTDSNGLMINNPRHFKKYNRKMRVEDRSLSRKIKGSNSWKKQCKKLSLLHHKIANIRRDFLQKESTRIAKSNSVVYIEDLRVKDMVKNKNLSKQIMDCGWSMFKGMLSYKTTVIAINPAYTSQTCHECKAKDKKSRISQSEYVCTICGHVSNADVNAAKNIKEKGILLDRQREALACA